MNEDFIFGVILGGVVVGLAMKKSVREGFKGLVLGVINKLKGKE
jgi:hypothetical protein